MYAGQSECMTFKHRHKDEGVDGQGTSGVSVSAPSC